LFPVLLPQNGGGLLHPAPPTKRHFYRPEAFFVSRFASAKRRRVAPSRATN
jgi:hypothetical protein